MKKKLLTTLNVKTGKHIFALLFIGMIATTSVHAQVVINEITPDPGNYDGQGAEWTELYNPDASEADVSCYVLTDGEEIVVIPDGTTIPAGGYLVIYNSHFFNCATCNWDGWAAGANVVTIDLATCGCTNQSGCNAVTWENSGGGGNPNNNDGERVVLFDASATIVDAIYYGSGARVNNGSAIAESQITNSKGEHGMITGQEITGGSCSLPASNDYTVPPTTDDAYENIGQNPIGCTSSIARATDGSDTWIIDNWPTPGTNNDAVDYTITATNTTIGEEVYSYSITNEVATPASVTRMANVCEASVFEIEIEVYNYNAVFNDIDGDANLLVSNGSNVDITGATTVTDASYIETVSGGTSTLVYTSPSISDNSQISFEVKENTQSCDITNSEQVACLTSGNIVGCGGAAECYIEDFLTVNVATPITSASFTCDNGLVEVTVMPTNATNVIYELLDQASFTATGGNMVATSTTGLFQVTTDPTNTYFIRITQDPECVPPIQATGTVCVFEPPCPEFADNPSCADNSATPCPGSMLEFGLDAANSSNLPDGPSIEWVIDSDNDDDVYDEDDSQVIGTQSVSVTSTECAYISGIMADPSGTDSDNEFFVIQNGADILPVNDIAVDFQSSVTDISSADDDEFVGGFAGGGSVTATGCTVTVLDDGDDIPANATVVVFVSQDNSNDWDFSSLDVCADGGTLYYLIYEYNGNSTAFSNDTDSGCPDNLFSTDLTVANSSCGTITTVYDRCTYGNENELISMNNTSGATVTAAASNTNGTSPDIDPASGATNPVIAGDAILTPPCITYEIPMDACNTTFSIRPRINPSQIGCNMTTGGPSETPTLAEETFTVTCPVATISGEAAICSGSAATIPVVLSDYGDCTTADVAYTTDGGATTTTVNGLTIADAQVILTGLMDAGTYELVSVTFSGCATTPCQASVSGAYVLSVADNPNNPVAIDTDVCMGQLTTISASGEPDLVWYSDMAGTTEIGSGEIINVTYSAATTVYVQSINQDNGCASDIVAVPLSIHSLPTANAGDDITICAESSLDLTGAPNGLTSYQWTTTAANNFTATTQSPSITSSATSDDAGTYTLYAEDENGCFATDDVAVTVNENPSFTPSLTQPDCDTDGSISFSELSGGTYTYAYSTDGFTSAGTTITPSGGTLTIDLSQGAQAVSTYTIRVTRTDITPNCSTNETIEVAAVTGCCTANCYDSAPWSGDNE